MVKGLWLQRVVTHNPEFVACRIFKRIVSLTPQDPGALV